MLFTILIGCGSCDDECDTLPPMGINFRLLDKITQKDLLGINGIYPIDKVKLLDKNGNNASGNLDYVSFDGNAGLRCFLSPFESDVYTKPIKREFYLHLTTTDIDTIKVEFMFQEEGRKKCRYDVVNYLKVWYNDSLYVPKDINNVFLNFLKKP